MLHRHLVKISSRYRAWHRHPRHGFWHWCMLATGRTLAALVPVAEWEPCG